MTIKSFEIREVVRKRIDTTEKKGVLFKSDLPVRSMKQLAYFPKPLKFSFLLQSLILGHCKSFLNANILSLKRLGTCLFATLFNSFLSSGCPWSQDQNNLEAKYEHLRSKSELLM